MTTRKHDPAGADSDADAPGDSPFVIDEATRAESEWLLARERDPGAPAPSQEIASDYAEIEHLLRNLSLGPSEDSWHDEVLRAAAATAAPVRSWWRSAAFRWLMGGGGAVLAAAVAVLVLIPRTPPKLEVLEVAIHHLDATRSDPKEAVVGDHLVVLARPPGAADLRVYRSGGTLVARCPSGPACRTLDQGVLSIDVRLDAPVQYQVILVVGTTGAFPDGAMDAFLDAARAANASITPYPIDVH